MNNKYLVHIKHRDALRGEAPNGPSAIPAGDYQVETGSFQFHHARGQERAICIKDVLHDQGGGDVYVRVQDYSFLLDFPALPNNSPLQILSKVI